ncbi:MAG: ATP-binding protein [Succinivibrio sp.]|nr:ATP-binding protein [Succinivibrio sp.]
MYRTVDDQLSFWAAQDQRKVLVMRGARQVGKTYAVRKLGTGFKYFAELNFEETPQAKSFFEGALTAQPLLEKLAVFTRTPMIPGQTLLFLDEIQACPKALTALRYFYEQCPALHVIAAGSLLEFALNEVPSLGVGRLCSCFMYPLTFVEFLRAIGEKKLLELLNGADFTHPLEEPFHLRLTEHLKTYLMTGGMPAAVAAYVRHHDLIRVMGELDDLLLTYQDDFAKYRQRVPTLRLQATFLSVAAQAGGKFVLARVDRNLKAAAISQALELLVKAGLVLKTLRTPAVGLPLGAGADHSFFKALPFDVGLHQRLLGLDLRELLPLSVAEFANRGSLSEVYTALQIASCTSSKHRPELFYWQREARNSQAEVDFILQRGNTILPVEVKCGTRGAMKSLRLFMQEKQLPVGVRVSSENFGTLPDVRILPLYAVHRLFDPNLTI